MNGYLTNVPQLLSHARRSFLVHGHDARAMKELTVLFSAIAEHAYGSRFVWSDYNKEQWANFVRDDHSWGCAALSAEKDGDCPHGRAFGIGGPTGLFPYHVWDLTDELRGEPIRKAVRSIGKYSLDLVG